MQFDTLITTAWEHKSAPWLLLGTLPRYRDAVELCDIGYSTSVAIMHLTREWLHVNRGLLCPHIFTFMFVLALMWVCVEDIFFEQFNTTRSSAHTHSFIFFSGKSDYFAKQLETVRQLRYLLVSINIFNEPTIYLLTMRT